MLIEKAADSTAPNNLNKIYTHEKLVKLVENNFILIRARAKSDQPK